jgi:hypothetical protein
MQTFQQRLGNPLLRTMVILVLMAALLIVTLITTGNT